MIAHAVDAFECWLWDRPADTYDNLKDALQGWVLDHTSGGGIYNTGGDYAVFLQVAVYEYAKAAHNGDTFHEVFPGETLAGWQPKAFILEKDAELLDQRWYQRELVCHFSPAPPAPSQPPAWDNRTPGGQQ